MNETLSHFCVNKTFKKNFFSSWEFVTLNVLGLNIYGENRLRGTGTSSHFSHWLLAFLSCKKWPCLGALFLPSSRLNSHCLLGSSSLSGETRPRSGWFVFTIGPAVPGLLFQSWKPQVWTLRQKAENKNVKKNVKEVSVRLSPFCSELSLSLVLFSIPAINILL